VSHVILDKTKKPIRKRTSITIQQQKKQQKPQPYTMVKSKSDLMGLKSYPEAFTIVTSPRRSPSVNCGEIKKRKTSNDDDEIESFMESDWIKPPASKLYEAAHAEDIEMAEDPPYITDIFGQHVSIPTTPILTDKIMIGSNR
jgi:hypothetical protein